MRFRGDETTGERVGWNSDRDTDFDLLTVTGVEMACARAKNREISARNDHDIDVG